MLEKHLWKENPPLRKGHLRALSSASVPKERGQWYLMWAERFSASLGEKPLGSADRVEAEAFIASLGRSPRAEAW
jgi:hypothetical protein